MSEASEEQIAVLQARTRVETRWQHLLERFQSPVWRTKFWGDMLPAVQAMMQQPALRQLFPFTSHATILLSETTDSPYAYTRSPAVRALDHGHFRVMVPRCKGISGTGRGRWKVVEWTILGEGDAEAVAALMVQVLPPGIGPAVAGSDPDLQ
jgi:hypothetical protein